MNFAMSYSLPFCQHDSVILSQYEPKKKAIRTVSSAWTTGQASFGGHTDLQSKLVYLNTFEDHMSLSELFNFVKLSFDETPPKSHLPHHQSKRTGQAKQCVCSMKASPHRYRVISSAIRKESIHSHHKALLSKSCYQRDSVQLKCICRTVQNVCS